MFFHCSPPVVEAYLGEGQSKQIGSSLGKQIGSSVGKQKALLNSFKIEEPTVYTCVNIYMYMNMYKIHIYTHNTVASHGDKCYHGKVFVTVTSLRRNVRDFTARLFYQGATDDIKGKAHASRAQSRCLLNQGSAPFMCYTSHAIKGPFCERCCSVSTKTKADNCKTGAFG